MGSRLQCSLWARSWTPGHTIFGVEIPLFADLMPVSGLTSCSQYRLVPPGQPWALSVICGQLGPDIRGGEVVSCPPAHFGPEMGVGGSCAPPHL